MRRLLTLAAYITYSVRLFLMKSRRLLLSVAKKLLYFPAALSRVES